MYDIYIYMRASRQAGIDILCKVLDTAIRRWCMKPSQIVSRLQTNQDN